MNERDAIAAVLSIGPLYNNYFWSDGEATCPYCGGYRESYTWKKGSIVGGLFKHDDECPWLVVEKVLWMHQSSLSSL